MSARTAPDVVSIDWFHEAELAQRIGYSLFCRIAGVDADLVVRDIRMIAGNNSDYEVRVLEGWRKPMKCWAVGDGTMKAETQPVQQEDLFK